MWHLKMHYLENEMTVSRSYGPYTVLRVLKDLVCGPNFMVYWVLKVKGTSVQTLARIFETRPRFQIDATGLET